MTTTTDDHRLLASFARDGDEAAFAGLVQRHGPMVAGVCRRILRGPSDADDAAQAVFLTLARKASAMLSHPDLVGWLHRCATNISRRQRDAERIRRRHERSAPLPAAGASPDAEAAAGLDEAIEALPTTYRVPLVLHHLEGCTQEAIAGRLGVPAGTIAWRLHRGRELLQRRLARRGAVAVVAVAAALADAGAGAAEVPAGLQGLARAAATLSGGDATAPSGVTANAWRMARSAARPRSIPLILGGGVAGLVLLGAVVWLAASSGGHGAVGGGAQATAADGSPPNAAEQYRHACTLLPPMPHEAWDQIRRGTPGPGAAELLAQSAAGLAVWRQGVAIPRCLWFDGGWSGDPLAVLDPPRQLTPWVCLSIAAALRDGDGARSDDLDLAFRFLAQQLATHASLIELCVCSSEERQMHQVAAAYAVAAARDHRGILGSAAEHSAAWPPLDLTTLVIGERELELERAARDRERLRLVPGDDEARTEQEIIAACLPVLGEIGPLLRQSPAQAAEALETMRRGMPADAPQGDMVKLMIHGFVDALGIAAETACSRELLAAGLRALAAGDDSVLATWPAPTGPITRRELVDGGFELSAAGEVDRRKQTLRFGAREEAEKDPPIGLAVLLAR